jgi:hypothetical protein
MTMDTDTTGSLRDRFAEIVLGFELQGEWETQEEMAAYCYEAADAMMAARGTPAEAKPSKPKVLNINDTVRVKLTGHGRAVLLKDDINRYTPAAGTKPTYTRIKEDAEGWSSWTLWVLMQTFGPHMEAGFNNCFDTTIEVVE